MTCQRSFHRQICRMYTRSTCTKRIRQFVPEPHKDTVCPVPGLPSKFNIFNLELHDGMKVIIIAVSPSCPLSRGRAYCQMIREPNKAKRLKFAKDNEGMSFEDVAWTDEATVQLETHRRFCCKKVRKGSLSTIPECTVCVVISTSLKWARGKCGTAEPRNCGTMEHQKKCTPATRNRKLK